VPSESNERITLARVVRPHGLRGEVAAEILTDFPERLAKLREVWLWNGAGAARKAEVRSCRISTSRGGQAIFHFAGADTVEAAEKLRGFEIQVPLSERAKLPAGSYYISELTGCEVWEMLNGVAEKLGVVRAVQTAGTPVLEVETLEGEVLIPFATEICTRIDVAKRRIDVALPEGLRDLNRK
jgi:16S rRNA processing protein RimM